VILGTHLADFLGSVSESEFFAKFWQSECLYVPSSGSEQFGRLFSLEDVDAALSAVGLCDQEWAIRLVRSEPDGRFAEVRPPRRSDGVNLASIYQYYADGYTVVAHKLEFVWRPLSELASGLRKTLGPRVNIAFYLTPPGSAGLAAHFDAQDIFIFQIYGSKQWLIYDQVDSVADGPRLPDNAPVRRTVELRAGDFLYMPRFTGHSARCDDAEASLHLTVAVTVRTVLDVVVAALQEKAGRSRVLQEAVWPIRDRQEIEIDLNRVLAAACTPDNLRDVCERLFESDMEAVDSAPDGHFRSLSYRGKMSGLSKLKVRATSPNVRKIDASTCAISFSGQTVMVPAVCFETICYIIERGQFLIGDLPGALSGSARIVLVERLMIAGLLTVVEV
jgi:hypothetical protein